MVITLWVILGLLFVLAVTYPDEFPTMVRNPPLLIDAIAMESKRRWMILKFGSILWISKQRLRFSLWRAKPIIEAERLKQKQQETTK